MLAESLRSIVRMVSWFGLFSTILLQIGFLFTMVATFFMRGGLHLDEIDNDVMRQSFTKFITRFILFGLFLGVIVYL
jgi:hypothetical protein